MSIQSLVSMLGEAAIKLDAKQHNELHATASKLAKMLQEYSSHERAVQSKKVSMGSRDNCLSAMKDLHAKLVSFGQKLHAIKANDTELLAVSVRIDEAIKHIEQMMQRRKAHS